MWKLILGSEIRTVGKNEKEVYSIVTNDPLNLILMDYIKDNKGKLVIDGIKYKPISKPSYHKKFSDVAKEYNRKSTIAPTKDIEKLVEACDIMHEAVLENERMYKLVANKDIDSNVNNK